MSNTVRVGPAPISCIWWTEVNFNSLEGRIPSLNNQDSMKWLKWCECWAFMSGAAQGEKEKSLERMISVFFSGFFGGGVETWNPSGFSKKNTKHPPKNIPVAMKPENKKKNAQKPNICPKNLQKGWISPRMFPSKPPKHLWVLPFRGAFSRGDVAGGVEELWRRFCYWTWKWRILYHQTFQVPKMEEFWPFVRVIFFGNFFSLEFKVTLPMPSPPRNKALLRAY